MKYIIKSVLFLSLIFSQNEIEGRWNPDGFNNTMYEFVDGLRYTYYCADENGCDIDYCNSLDTSDAIPNPNPYWIDGNTLTIDLFFGNEATYTIGFRCDGQVVDFYYDEDDWAEGLHSTMFRLGFDDFNNDCLEPDPDNCLCTEEWDPVCGIDGNTYSNACFATCEYVVIAYEGECLDINPDECFDLSEIDFGMCDMYLGVGWNGYQCDYFSGCDWIIDDIDYSDYLFNSMEECEDNCECEDGEIIDDNPCNPMECFDGQWYEIIIDCAEEMGIPCEGGLYIAPDEGECCSECILFGDINYDHSINILDVVETVQLVLGGGYNEIVDINYDGSINILDIIEIIQIILND